MDYTDKVIILRIGRFKEADLWVRFLSPERGIVTAFAFGGSRSRKRFGGCLDHLNIVTVHVRGGGTYQRLEEGTLETGPKRLRKDIGRLGLAVNCQKFMEAMGVGREGAEKVYELFLNMLRLLEREKEIDPILPLLFRTRLAFDQGYTPALGQCAGCGRHLNDSSYAAALVGSHREPLRVDIRDGREISLPARTAYCTQTAKVEAVFHVREGALYCPSCMPPSGPQFRMGKEALDAMRFVQENSPLQWPVLCLSPRGRKELTRAVDGFIQFHVGLAWNNGMFRKV